MDMTQIAMQLRTQMLQQGGPGEVQFGQGGESGTSFADLIMSMLSNPQSSGNFQGNDLLNNVLLNNMQSGAQTEGMMQDNGSSEFLDVEAFASEYGGILNTLAKGILEGNSEVNSLDFSVLANNSGKTEKPVEKPVQTLMPEVTEKTEEPVEKPVQMLMPEVTEKTEEPVEKPVQMLMPETAEKTEEPVERPVQMLMPETAEKTEEPVEKPVQMLMPEVAEKTEEPVEKPVQTLMPEVAEKTEEPVEKPVQTLMPEVAEKTEEPVEKPVQMLMPEVTEKTEEPVEKPVQTLMPEVAEKTEKPVEKPVQMLMPETAEKTEEPVERPVQTLMPEVAEKTEEPVERPVQMLMPEVAEKTEEPVERPVQMLMPETAEKTEEPVERPVQMLMPETAEKTEEPVEKPVQMLMPETAEKAEEPVERPVLRSDYPVRSGEVKKLEIPLSKRDIDNLIRSGKLRYANGRPAAVSNAETHNAEENYYPVTMQNDNSFYADAMQYTNLFGLPGFKPNNSKEDVKISDFSENIIKADPIQLSGLLGMVMTGSSIPANNEILSTVYKDMPYNGSVNAVDNTAEINTAAFDIVSKYIESGEVEIIGYKPEDVIQQNTKMPEQQFRPQQTADEKNDAVKPEAVQAENSDKAVSNNNDMLNVYRTMHAAKETMSEARKTEKTESAEFETIQENVTELDIRFDRIDSEIKMNQRFEAPEKQIAKGVEENLKKGKSEFTVKLKPEGLGEIIVKLVKNDGGKMLMSMVASNIKTAELLNKNINALQSSLNAQNVEIINPKDMTKTVMPMTPAFEQYYNSQQNGGMYQHQQQHDQQQFSSRDHGMRTYNDVDDDETFDAKAQSPVETDGLNIMI